MSSLWGTACNTQTTCNAHLQENRQINNLIIYKETVSLGLYQNETQKFGIKRLNAKSLHYSKNQDCYMLALYFAVKQTVG